MCTKNSVKTGSRQNIKYNIIVSFLFKRKPLHSFETAFYMDVCEGKIVLEDNVVGISAGGLKIRKLSTC